VKLYSENDSYKLYQGNMLDMLEVIEKESIDSIVTDPPYELNFMSKGWDNAGVSFQSDTWRKCYEVLKPGGYLLAFGGSRTFHRIACAIEDAGFEIRDTIMYLYGSGFPKSQNIGKQLEKRLNDEKTKQKTKHDLLSMWERDIQATKSNEKTSEMVLQPQLQEQSLQKPRETTSNVWREEPCLEGWSNIQKTERELQRCKVCEMSKRVFINGEERWICNGTQISDGKTLREMFEQSGSCPSYRPQPEQQFNRELNAIQEQWGTQACREVIENWKKIGTALKPSFEPIIVARKPFKGSLVDNVIEYGVGGLNIDECRVGAEIIKGGTMPKMGAGDLGVCNYATVGAERIERQDNIGRFPANTILTYDETDFDEVCGGFPNTKSGGGDKRAKNGCSLFFGNSRYNGNTTIYKENSGSASRYFYCAKASKKDRDEGLENFIATTDKAKGNGLDRICEFCGVSQLTPELCHCETKSWITKPKKNTHPTVKPTELMQYLVRLVTPDNGIVLDPFNGSGSTGKAVMYENRERNKNYKYIGIELTEEYLPISKARIEYVCNLKEEQDMQMTIFDYLEDNKKLL
jgi:DNA modification methylase